MTFPATLAQLLRERFPRFRQSAPRRASLRRDGLDQCERLESRIVLALALTATEYSAGITAGSIPRGITLGPDGNLWFAEQIGRNIGQITPTGTVTEFASGVPAPGSLGAITLGPDGNLWFNEIIAGVGEAIGRMTPTGTVTRFSAGVNPLAGIFAITSGPDGNLWFTENQANQIGRITPTGAVTEFPAGSTFLSRPYGITSGPDGNLWFTEQIGNRIARITPTGTVTEFTTGLSAGSQPSGITLGADGNLWFTEYTGDTIGRITPTGTITEFSTGITAGSHPFGITSGPDGNLWFTEFDGNRIGRITLTGTVTEYGSGITAGSEPNDIVTGPDGNLWFTEAFGNRVATLTGFTPVTLANSISTDFYAPTTNLATNQPITLTVTPIADLGGPTPTGNVFFYDGATLLATQPLVGGVAIFTQSSLPVGAHNLFAIYNGDANYLGGQSPTTVETVSASVVESGTGGDTVTATGSAAPDTFIVNYAAGRLLSLNMNGTQFIFDSLVVTDVSLLGNGGGDTAAVLGTAGADAFTLGANTLGMTGQNTQNVAVAVTATGIQRGIVDGNGGTDTTTMSTSTVDDIFLGVPGTSAAVANYGVLFATGGTFANYAYHSNVTAIDGGGSGTHGALLYTSLADDTLTGSPTALEAAGAGFNGAGAFDFIAQSYPAAAGFNATGSTGTHAATLDSSTSDDFFIGNGSIFAESMSATSGVGAFNNVAYNFTTVVATNTDTTATHSAYLYSSANNDAFAASPTTATLVGTTAGSLYNFTVNGYASVTATNLGTSTAQLTGVADDDRFTGSSTYAQMTNGSTDDAVKYKNTAYGFATVTATTALNSTASVAALVDDTNGDNTFTGNLHTGTLLQNTVVNFAVVNGYKTGTGTDTADKTNLDYIFQEIGNWSN